jgi:PAS domain S-box-containing protein
MPPQGFSVVGHLAAIPRRNNTVVPESPDRPYLVRWLEDREDEIIDEWVYRLSRLSTAYRRRLTSELYHTVTWAFRANFQVLESGQRTLLEDFIAFITQKRLQSGFPLSDVQRAFEMFRVIVVARLKQEGRMGLLAESTGAINDLLAYTIHRFSDHFQQMAESAIRRHAKDLERQVQLRTAELAESERRYKTLVNEINDGYLIVQDRRVVFANQAFCRMHGAIREEVVGRLFSDFVTPDCQDEVADSLRGSPARRSAGGLVEYTRAGCPVEEAATELRFRVVDLGQGPVMIGICRDISSRVAMEAKIREHQKMAYMGHIAASLSHEIRNPLATCTLNMMVLNDKLNLEGFDRRRLEITVRELTRLEAILHQLLDAARPLSLQMVPVNLADVARDVVDLLAAKAVEAKVVIRQHHPAHSILVKADFAKMEQALLNLLLNALEALGPGGRIIIWSRAVTINGERQVELGVHDDGTGLDPARDDELFTPFYTNKTRGTGLGLSNVKRIMEAHEGSVAVKGRPGVGATFILRLPWR